MGRDMMYRYIYAPPRHLPLYRSPAVQKSPVLAAFARTVALLHSQLEMSAKLQQGIVNEVMLRARIGEEVRTSSPARRVAQETDARYEALFHGVVSTVIESDDTQVPRTVVGLPVGQAPTPEAYREEISGRD